MHSELLEVRRVDTTASLFIEISLGKALKRPL